MFLKNRELRLTVGKKTKKDKDEGDIVMDDLLNADTVDRIEDAGRRLIEKVAITVVTVVAVIKVADTLSQIAVKKTKSADQK